MPEIADGNLGVICHQLNGLHARRRADKAARLPKFITSVMFGIMGLLKASMKDNVKAMQYVSGGNYAADVTRQTQVFGPPSTMEVSIKRWVAKNGSVLAAAK